MGFFNKFTNVWKKIGFKETEEMRKFREQYEALSEELRIKETEISRNKDSMKRARMMYQHVCTHDRISRRNRAAKTDLGNFNDFSAKCDICGAEMYDQAKAINYINSTIDMMYKISKTLESAKMAGVTEDNDTLYNKTFEMIDALTDLRTTISSMKSDEYNNHIFKNTVKEED